ncbi:erythromycin esterase family protein [Sphingopyxis fribergensis]
MTFFRPIGAALMLLLWTTPSAAAAPADDAFVAWARTHAITLPACSSILSGGNYASIAETIGGARVLALGEPAHGAHEPLAFRNCLFRHLVEEQGFTAIAIESGLHESRRLHDYAAGGPGDLRDLARTGLTWGFWRYPENIELLEWIRAYNLDPAHRRKIAFYGVDMSGGDADGTWARARITLDEGIAFLARTAPVGSEDVRKDIAPLLSRFSASAYRALSAGDRRTLHGAITRLIGFFDTNRAALIAASSPADYGWARQNVVAAQQLQTLFDVSDVPDPDGRLLPGDYRADAARDAAMAANTLWALDREGSGGRILLFAHNGHVMNARSRGGIWAVYRKPPAAMGVHLRRALGRDLSIIGGSSPARGDDTGAPGTIDSALGKVGLGNFLLDIRRPSGGPKAWLSRDQSISVNTTTENLIVPTQAFDFLVFFDRLTPSEKGP